ncbi:MAG TPA: YCF48-related protein, partial [Ignavibacteria bacterium]|nr:YCF48-related protein [Ignavibacteria bacterium]
MLAFGNLCFADGLNSIHTSDGVYVIAAGDQGNILRSLNGGNTWAKYTEPSVNFKSVFISGSNVWLTGDNGKVYKSSTSSVSLTAYNTGVTTSINSIFFTDALNGYICGDNGVLYKSVDGGISWTLSNSGINTVKLNSLNFKDAANGIVVGNSGIVYMTVNGGASWTAETVSTTRNLTDAKYFSDGIAITGEWGTLLIKYGTGSWAPVVTRINSDIKSVSGTSASDIHVCGGGGFIRNNKNSNTTFLNFEVNPMLANLVDIVFANINTGFAVSSLNNAVIRTTNGGTSWELPSLTSVSYSWEAKPGASGNFLGNNMSLHPTDRNTIFIAFGNQVYRSRNKGDSWSTLGSPIPAGNTPHSFYVSPIDTNIWLVAIEGSPDKIYRTTDYGQTWSTVGPNRNFSSYGQPLEMDQNNPHIFYFAPDNGGFYKSTDDGATFTEIS